MAIQPRPTSGTTFGAPLGTLGGSTSFPLLDPRTAFGGCMQVATTAARNAIEVPYLQNGMLVWVEADDTYYKLKSTWPGGVLSTDPDWEVAIGPGAGITGIGNSESIAIWTSATNLSANVNFTRSNATGLVYNSVGFRTGFNINVERWVSTTGNDSNDGATVLTPWLTLAHAMQQCPKSGSGIYLIHMENGTYNETSFSVPPYACSFDRGDGFRTIILIQGDTVTPSNVVLQNPTGTICYHNAKNVVMAFQGVTFQGDIAEPNSRGINQEDGQTIIEDCGVDSFSTFCSIQNRNSRISFGGTLDITDVLQLVQANYAAVDSGAVITFTPPNPLTGAPYLVNSFASDVRNDGNVTMTCPALASGGALFYCTGGTLDLGRNIEYNALDVDCLFIADGNAQVRAGENNTTFVSAGDALFRLNGSSQFTDSTGTWIADSTAGLVIPMSTSAKFSSPNFAQVGTPPGPFIIRNDLVEYVNYLPNPNYYANADDNRYVTTTTFRMFGNLPQNGTTMLIGPAGVTSAEQYIYVPEIKEQLLGIRVYTDVGNGGGNTDTYFAYVNDAASGLSVALTNTQTNSATASSIITLSAGDRVSIRCTSAAATTAENITVTILTRKRL